METARALARSGRTSIVASAVGPQVGRLDGAEHVAAALDRKDPLSIALNGVSLARLIRERGVSLVHARSRAPSFSALWAARRAGVPLIASYHGVHAAGWPGKRWYNSILTRGDRVIANSQFTRAHIIDQHRIDPARIAVIPEGVDVTRFDPRRVSEDQRLAQRAAWGAGDGRRVILAPGRLTDWKGHDTALAAMAGLGPEAMLIILDEAASATGLADRLRTSARAAGRAANLVFAGRADGMASAYAAADIVVAPSRRAESFGRAVVEAMAMERPLIASDIGAHRETVAAGGYGTLAPPDDIAAWRAALAAADRQKPAGAHARIAAAYSLRAMTDATFALYAEVLAER